MLPFQVAEERLAEQLEAIAPLPATRRVLRCELERRKRKLRQADVARLLHIAQSKVAQIEQGARKPGRALALKLMRFYGLDRPEALIEEVA